MKTLLSVLLLSLASVSAQLAWDAETKEINPAVGVTNVQFVFWLTNVSDKQVSVNLVRTSCGCAVAELPPTPWDIPAGTNGAIRVNVDLHSKAGTFTKTVTVATTAGKKDLFIRVNMPNSLANPTPGLDADRLKNMRQAMADRQVVFKGECVKCHVEPGQGKLGGELYTAVCGICHDAAHRAALVPDLKKLPHPTSAEHWRKWIIEGRVGSMMPAFAKEQGGPLSSEQIESLVVFLTEGITRKK